MLHRPDEENGELSTVEVYIVYLFHGTIIVRSTSYKIQKPFQSLKMEPERSHYTVLHVEYTVQVLQRSSGPLKRRHRSPQRACSKCYECHHTCLLTSM